MADFEHIRGCFDITEDDIVDAIASRGDTRELLEHAASISAPNEGGPKALLVLARMATTACDWLEGDLRVEVGGDEEVSVIEVMSEMGGFRERVFPTFAMKVPLAEFINAVQRVPKLIAPLVLKSKTATRIVFTATEDERKTSLPPPSIEIDEESLLIPQAAALVAPRTAKFDYDSKIKVRTAIPAPNAPATPSRTPTIVRPPPPPTSPTPARGIPRQQAKTSPPQGLAHRPPPRAGRTATRAFEPIKAKRKTEAPPPERKKAEDEVDTGWGEDDDKK